jgi:hypothetical protein
MDDEKFKKELLSRLDKILALLSISCAVMNGSIDKAKAETAMRQVLGPKPAEKSDLKPEMVNDEMQDNYAHAMQQWQAQKQA